MSKQRSIFEDVTGEKQVAQTPKGGLIQQGSGNRRAIAIWLLILFTLVVLMILVGGLTRLTDSGLSITEWRPVTGALPPLSETAWLSEFTKYQASPEYILQNNGMDIEAFKVIYWWEWGHRQLGRLVGLVWFVGFMFFLLTKRIPRGWVPRLLGVGILGGIQGAIGWWMVSSGLTGRMVDVASYRLAIHLGMAFLILSVLIWLYWLLKRDEMDLFQARRTHDSRLMRLSTILYIFVFVQVLLGALVAGIDAGRGYIDWPLMNGEFLPSESFDYEPLWSNAFENPALVQFNHRMVGYFVALFAVFVWVQSQRSALKTTRNVFSIMLGAMAAQIILGITTILYAAPWHIAIVHQLGAVLLLVLILRGRFLANYPPAQSLR